MARKGRIQSKTGIYHILLRGVNQLFCRAEDYAEFTQTLKRYIPDGNIKIYAYTLLKNRVHLVIDAGDDVGKALKPICTSYARYFNRTHGEIGKLFYDRFKSEPIDTDEDLKAVVAFVNSISQKCQADYPYCSLSAANSDLVYAGKLTLSEQKSTAITSMFIEDFDCLSQKELSQYIFDLCGIMPKDFKGLSKDDLNTALEKLTKKRWIARTKLYEILGIKKVAESNPIKSDEPKPKVSKKQEPKPKAQKKEEPQPEPKREQRRELSVWLL